MSDLRSPDHFDELLTQLAPEVDIDVAQRSFERARMRSTVVRRLGVAGVATAMTVVLVIAVVVNSADTTVSTSDPGVPSSTTVAPADEEERNTFVLPEAGEARSVLLDDGTPVWIVNHGDGTATAVIALYRASMFEPPLDHQLFSPVVWNSDGAFTVHALSRRDPDKALTWDAWGRAITADANLAGLSVSVENGRAVIERDEAGDAPGPAQDVAWTEHGSARTPLLPELVPLGDLPPGWHQVDADLVVGIDGTARLCEPVPNDEPVAGTGRSLCPPGTPEVTALDGLPFDELRLFAPLVVRVDRERRVDGIYPLGGMASRGVAGGVEPGQNAPALSGLTVAGDEFDLLEMGGRAVIVSFVASWCVPCEAIVPVLDEVVRHRSDVAVVVVAYDDDPARVKALLDDARVDWPVVVDPTGQVASDWLVQGLPETYVVDSAGRIVEHVAGQLDATVLERAVP